MVEEELDETAQWLDIVMECDILPRKRVEPLHEECIELLKITSRSIVTMKKKLGWIDCEEAFK